MPRKARSHWEKKKMFLVSRGVPRRIQPQYRISEQYRCPTSNHDTPMLSLNTFFLPARTVHNDSAQHRVFHDLKNSDSCSQCLNRSSSFPHISSVGSMSSALRGNKRDKQGHRNRAFCEHTASRPGKNLELEESRHDLFRTHTPMFKENKVAMFSSVTVHDCETTGRTILHP